MATVSKKTIFMGINKPSDKCLLVSIPMKMYRIQTNKFTSGLNYFQKAVLKLKFMPRMSNDKIAGLLHLDEHLVNIIVSQLEAKELITSAGFLTPKGEQLRNDTDGILIDEREKQLGYIFSYSEESELFPYYQPRVVYVDRNNGELLYQTENGTLSVELPFDITEGDASPASAPSEEQILQIIKNSAYRSTNSESEIDDISEGLLKIRFIPDDKPEDVSVCTYVYLPESEDDDTYSDDWHVSDPFRQGDNYELKLYLEMEKKRNKAFNDALNSTFKNAVTENNKRYDESQAWFEETVNARIDELFGRERFEKMGSKMKQSIYSVVSYYMQMERHDFRKIEYGQIQMFFINTQAALETVLMHDQQKRKEAYKYIENCYGIYSTKDDRQQCLRNVYGKRLLSGIRQQVPNIIYYKKTKDWKGKSLMNYLMKFIMTLEAELDAEDYKIIGLIKNRIDTIIRISEIRNNVGHGNMEDKTGNDSFGGNDAKEYFQFMTDFINDYLSIL